MSANPPSKGSASLSDQNKAMLVQKGGTRLTCPQCGNNNKNMIREAEDPTHKVYDYPLIYGKKYKCGKCGIWWRWDQEEGK